MRDLKRGVAIVTYNRADHLGEIMDAVQATVPKDTKLVVADDGSDDGTLEVVRQRSSYLLVRGPNQGVAINKNRALAALQECDLLCILEDDLSPIEDGWFSQYERALIYSGIHHWCRVQDKVIEETVPTFSQDMYKRGWYVQYGPSPRGDFTFISKLVVSKVGGLNPEFKGAGYAHGEWSERIVKAGLVPHPLKWIDLRVQGRDMFKQIGDTEGGRWNRPKEEIKAQIQYNKRVQRKLKQKDYLFQPLVLQ